MSLLDEFVPYEQALALKELGFDAPCFTKFKKYFSKTTLAAIIATLSLNSPYEHEYNGYDQNIINDSTKRWFFTGYKNSVKDHNHSVLSAPTYSQAFDWLLKEHHLYGIVIPTITMDWTFKTMTVVEGMVEVPPYKHVNAMDYSTHSIAKLKCLKKLIELCKNKK